ncbi:hypothetical protein ABZW49_10260 [Nonomuraea wenchangensis]
MARLGRGVPNRPVVSRHPRNWDWHVSLATFETTSEWPALTVETPNANVSLATFETTSEWPDLGFAYDYGFTLATFETTSEWPAIGASVPILPGDSLTGAAGQVEWNGTLWGPGTDFTVQEILGWRSLPQLDNLNVERPSRHGAWAGRRLAQQRIVTIKLQPNSISDPTAIDDLLAQLDAVTGVLEDEREWPLVIAGYGATQLAFGAVVDRDVPMNDGYSVGAPPVSVMIVCSDPRRYSLTRTGVDLVLNQSVEVTNAGNVATHPILRINGPVTSPSIENTTLNRLIEFSITLASGEQMTIDTDAGTVMVGGNSQMQTLTGSSVPVTEFVLGRGINELHYTADSGGDRPVVCLYRDAWL